MSDLESPTSTALESLVLANSPDQLYRFLRRDEFVERLSRQHTARELVSIASRAARHRPISLEEAARAYAALVALRRKEPSDVVQALGQTDLSGLEWAARLVEEVLRSEVHSTSESIFVMPRIETPSEQLQPVPSTQSNQVLRGRVTLRAQAATDGVEPGSSTAVRLPIPGE